MNQPSFPQFSAPSLQSEANNDVVLDFGKIFSILRRGWMVIFIGGLGGALIAAAWVLQVSPSYSGKAQLLMGQTSRNGNMLGALVQDLNLDDDAIAGEIAIITSGRLLSMVSARLGLSELPEFNPDLAPPAPEAPLPLQLADQAADWLKGLLMGDPGAPPAPRTDAENSAPDPIALSAQIGRESLGDQADYVGALMRSLRVRQVGNTDLVDITFVSGDPRIAAAVPNTVVDIYIEDQLNRKFMALRRLTDGLETRLAKMRERLEVSERAVIDFRTRNLADGFPEKERIDQQLNDLSRRLGTSTAVHAELASELRGMDAIIAENGAAEAAGLFTSDLIERMRSQIIELKLRRARTEEQSAPGSSQLQSVDDAISRLENVIAAEVIRLRDDHAKRVKVAAGRMAALQTELRKLEGQAIRQAEREVTLTQLERDYAAQQAVYGTFLDKFTETSEALNLQEGDAQVIAYSETPTSPFAPDKKMSVVLGGVAGGFAGTGLVFLLAMMDTRIRSNAQLRGMTPTVPVFSLPRVGRIPFFRPDPIATRSLVPLDPLVEGISSVRSHVMLSGKGNQGRLVAVLSTSSGMGKTTASVLLARSIAQMGVSCVVVDTDLRRADVARRLNLTVEPDIVDVITGATPLVDALKKDPASEARILTARKGVADPSGLLLSKAVGDLIGELRNSFDVVIVDTAPLMPVSDAVPMVKLADNLLMMVRHGTPREEVQTGLAILEKLGPSQLSIALSMVPTKQQAYDGYR